MSAPDSELMSYAVRMVIPIKREFGRSVDVHHFLHDLPYAKEVIELALTSKDERLKSYADYMQSRLLGPRGTTAPAVNSAPPSETTAIAPKDLAQQKSDAMEKYKTRLR